MNYSSSISRKAIGKRILISWLAVGLVGGGIGWGIAHYTAAQNEVKPLYGVYDRQTLKQEISKEFAGRVRFIPLNVPMERDLQEFVFYLSTAYRIDYSLAMAIIEQESGFEKYAISETGDYGLMQINESNFADLTSHFGIDNFLEPYSNVRAGMWMLSQLFRKYQTPEKVLMAYNMGEHGAMTLWERGIFETAYTRAVLKKQAEYQDELGGLNNGD